MNFNKCIRCGCFFTSEGSTCPNCLPKEQMEMNKLENFINENIEESVNLDYISSYTGISEKNLNRFLAQKQFSDFANRLNEQL